MVKGEREGVGIMLRMADVGNEAEFVVRHNGLNKRAVHASDMCM